MRKLSILTVCLMFLAFVLGLETKGVAQEYDPNYVDYSNSGITTDCCPQYKQKLANIFNGATFIFEG